MIIALATFSVRVHSGGISYRSRREPTSPASLTYDVSDGSIRAEARDGEGRVQTTYAVRIQDDVDPIIRVVNENGGLAVAAAAFDQTSDRVLDDSLTVAVKAGDARPPMHARRYLFQPRAVHKSALPRTGR